MQSQPPQTQETDYDADIEVVQPYSIEEPGDEPTTSEPRRPVVSSLPDNFERWHVDLIESMDDLQCESDTNSSSQRSGQKRGQKRKPGVTTAGATSSSRQGSEAKGTDLSRKRARRRIKRSREDSTKSVYDSSSTATASNGSESVMSFSSARPSTEPSGTETGNVNSESKTDKMDVD